MPPEVSIHPATAADAAELLQLRHAVLAEGRWFTMEPDELRESVASRELLLRHLLRSGNSVALTARAGGVLVGVVQIEGGELRRIRHVGRLELMVAEAWRGKGVGAALLASSLAAARRSPALEKVELAVYAHNTRAVELYTRHGFLEEGRRVRQQRLPGGEYADEIWMSRWLRVPSGS